MYAIIKCSMNARNVCMQWIFVDNEYEVMHAMNASMQWLYVCEDYACNVWLQCMNTCVHAICAFNDYMHAKNSFMDWMACMR